MIDASRLGLHLPEPGTKEPAQMAVFAAHASSVSICLFDRAGRGIRAEHRLNGPVNGVWSGPVPGIREGDLYSLRVDGPWDPENGLRHNRDKLLIDPYARLLHGEIVWGQATFGHQVDPYWRPVDSELGHGGALRRDSTPNVGLVPTAVAVRDVAADASLRPRTPWDQTVVYEAHLRGFTMAHPEVPEEIRGTWAGLAHPAVVGYLQDLGVTAVELLPVFAIADETHLVERGMINYWGYNTLNYFAPELRYVSKAAQAAGPEAILAEVRDAVATLHEAGLEVWLDVVYNHTAEGGVYGPTLTFRGLDAPSYYRLDHHGRDVDVTGCGNTLDFSNARIVQLTLDSLRYWVTTFGIDGYRFDLAPALGRRANSVGGGYDPDHPFLVAARTDPVLADVKLVAEPWDIGHDGWRTGGFPPPFAEWNDRFRDTVRSFWLSDVAAAEHGSHTSHVADLATRLAGSSDRFGVSQSADHVTRPLYSSINFVTAHDGFTLADLTAYNHKHNYANGEDNRDGSSHNRSWNHGEEGPTDDPEIQAARAATARAMLGTLLLAQGTPMLLAGDEIGRTQHGNNNPYCLDAPSVWTDWESADPALYEHVRTLLRLRAEHPALRQTARFSTRRPHPDGNTDLAWFGPAGTLMVHHDWHDPNVHTLQMYLRGHDDDASLLLVLHNGPAGTEVTLPDTPWASGLRLLWDSWSHEPHTGTAPLVPAGYVVKMPGRCVRLYEVVN